MLTDSVKFKYYIYIYTNINTLKIDTMTIEQSELRAAEIAAEILELMGGNPEDICTGDCTTFAKRMIDKLTADGIEAVIIDNLSDEMKSELNGYSVEQGNNNSVSHCYISILDGWMFFDAFDIEGKYNESDLQYTWRCK
jgi:hypothetical protein